MSGFSESCFVADGSPVALASARTLALSAMESLAARFISKVTAFLFSRKSARADATAGLSRFSFSWGRELAGSSPGCISLANGELGGRASVGKSAAIRRGCGWDRLSADNSGGLSGKGAGVKASAAGGVESVRAKRSSDVDLAGWLGPASRAEASWTKSWAHPAFSLRRNILDGGDGAGECVGVRGGSKSSSAAAMISCAQRCCMVGNWGLTIFLFKLRPNPSTPSLSAAP